MASNNSPQRRESRAKRVVRRLRDRSEISPVYKYVLFFTNFIFLVSGLDRPFLPSCFKCLHYKLYWWVMFTFCAKDRTGNSLPNHPYSSYRSCYFITFSGISCWTSYRDQMLLTLIDDLTQKLMWLWVWFCAQVCSGCLTTRKKICMTTLRAGLWGLIREYFCMESRPGRITNPIFLVLSDLKKKRLSLSLRVTAVHCLYVMFVKNTP